MSKVIFKDPALQEQFEREGFAKLRLLEPEDIEVLREMFHSYFPEVPPAFNSSSYLSDYATKDEICWKVAEVLRPRLEKHFVNFRLFGSAFLSKAPGPHSEMPMHQDWSIVDESQFVAVNIWTPLQATTEHNGTIEVLKGSHKYFHVLRAPTLPFVFKGMEDTIKQYLTPVPAEAGDAVVLNQAVVHYSKPNLSDAPRLAITTGVCSAEAPFRFFYTGPEVPEGKLEEFAMEDRFLNMFENFHQDIFQRPTMGESIGFVDYELPIPTPAELQQYLHEYYPQATPEPVSAGAKPWWKRIFS